MAGKKMKRPVPRKPVSLDASPWDTGPRPAAREHLAVVEERGEVDPRTGRMLNPNRVCGLRYRDLLEVWHTRGVISGAGHDAAVRLRDAFEATQRAPGWPDNDRVQSSPKPDHAVTITVERISAFHRLNRLVAAGDRAIVDACVLEQGTPARAGYKGERYQDGLAHLCAALDRLAAAVARRT